MPRKEKKGEEVFDYETSILNMNIPSWLQDGFLYHIADKKLEFKSEKDLEKEFDKFMKGVE